VRIVLHAGLHKSGTTAVQAAWREAYGEAGSAWYPSRPGWRQPGHHLLTWPLLRAYRDEEAADLVLARRRRRGRDDESLSAVVEEAESQGVETLVLSTEELDRVQAADVPAIETALRGHDVTAVLTVTRPVHRWCSGWQELVKHGLPEYPRDAAPHILAFASLRPGRLAEISRLLPAKQVVIRLVRTDPAEPQLARDVASVVGLPHSERIVEVQVRNRSLGVDIEIVRRINSADAGLGTLEPAAKDLLRSIREQGASYAEIPGLAERYRLPEDFARAVGHEVEFLQGDHDASVVVADPHGLRATWTDVTPPDWYAAISRREAVVPELDGARDPEEQLWRLRQERVALRARLEQVERQLAEKRGGGAR
jgi:hypothetical protein